VQTADGRAYPSKEQRRTSKRREAQARGRDAYVPVSRPCDSGLKKTGTSREGEGAMNQSAEKREDQRRHQSGSQISGVEEGRLELSERGVKMEQKRWSGKILVAHRQEPGVRPLPFPRPCQLACGEKMGYGLVEPVGVRLQLVSFARKSPMAAPIFSCAQLLSRART